MIKKFFRPKLEAGVSATPWQPCSTYTGSLIRQTADMVSVEVYDIVSGETYPIKEDVAKLTIDANAISGVVSSLSSSYTVMNQELDSLSGSVSGYSAEIESINHDIANIVDEISTITGDMTYISGITDSINSLSATSSAHTEEIASLSLTSSSISGVVSSLSSSYTVMSGEISSLSGSVSGNTDNIYSISASTSQNSEQIGSLSLTTSAISGSVSNLSSSITDINTEITNLSGSVSSVTASISANTEQIGSLALTTSAISGSVSDITDKVTNVSNEISNLSGSVASIYSTVSGHTEQIGSLALTTSAISGSVSNISDSLSQVSADVISISGNVSGIDSQISGLTADIQGIDHDIENINEVISTITGDISFISGITDSITELSATTSAHTEQIASLTLTSNAISGSVSDISDRVTTLSNQQQSISAITSAHTEQIGSLAVTSTAISGSVSSISDRLTTVTDNVSSISATTQQNVTDIGNLTLTSQAISGSVSHLNEEFTSVYDGLSSLSATSSAHTEQIGSLAVTSTAISGSVSSISTDVSTLSNTLDGTNQIVSGHTEQIGTLTLQASGFSTHIEELEERSANDNLLPVNGWTDKNGNTVDSDEKNAYSASTSHIQSPTLWLTAGDYTISSYNNGDDWADKYFTIRLSGNTTPALSAYTVTEEYCQCSRKAQLFHVENDCYAYFLFGDNESDTLFFRPKLEQGRLLTAYVQQKIEYNSLISQTSQQITLEVNERISEEDVVGQFKRTGIDITSGKVVINADNTLVNGNLLINAQDSSDALSLADYDGNEVVTITSLNIGQLSGQSQSTSQVWQESETLQYGDSTDITLGTKYFTVGSKVTSGSMITGRVAYLSLIKYDGEKWLSQNINNANSCTLQLKLIKGGNTVTLPSLMIGYAGERNWLEASRTGGSDTVTIQSEGLYDIVLSVTFDGNIHTSPFLENTKFQCSAYMTVDADSKTLVGGDGLYSTNGEGKYIHFSTDGFHTSDMASTSHNLSTCAAMQSDTDHYLSTSHHTGIAHIADFRVGGEKWTTSQQHGNVQTCVFTSTNHTQQGAFTPWPSTDVILASHEIYADLAYIDLSSLEYEGSEVTVYNMTSPHRTALISSSPSKFLMTRKSANAYASALYVNDSFPASGNADGWTSVTLMYTDVQTGEYRGLWLIKNIESFTLDQ